MPKTLEIDLLQQYVDSAPDGALFTEGNAPLPGRRRLDGLIFPGAPRDADLETCIANHSSETPVQVIEVKSGLSEEVIGQVLVGAEMFRPPTRACKV